MSEREFFAHGSGLALGEVVDLTGARLFRMFPTERRIRDIAAPERAGPADITFIDAADDVDRLRRLQAGACLVRDDVAAAVPQGVAVLVVDDPYRAFVRTAIALYPQATRPSSLFEVQGVAPSALVHPTARVETGVTIDPAAMVGPRAEIGAGTVIGPMVVIGPDVRIGRDCSIGAGASLTNALIGDRVVIQPGCRIGQAAERGDARQARAPGLGRVILQDGVEVGANGAIDRGGYGDTIVGEATFLDALVRLPGDAMVGRHCTIVADGELRHGGGAGGVSGPFEDGLQLSASQVVRQRR